MRILLSPGGGEYWRGTGGRPGDRETKVPPGVATLPAAVVAPPNADIESGLVRGDATVVRGDALGDGRGDAREPARGDAGGTAARGDAGNDGTLPRGDARGAWA
jgi:hypothetical protein